MQLDSSNSDILSLVLTKEVAQYNKLLKIVHAHLNELTNSIKGLSFMSEEYEEMYDDLINDKVPDKWINYSCHISKCLPKWISEHKIRLDYMQVRKLRTTACVGNFLNFNLTFPGNYFQA